MIPTREDLINLLSKEPQISVHAVATQHGCEPLDVLRVFKRHDNDFEQVAPRPQDGLGFAWRLSSLSVDKVVRDAALRHQRNVEQPPQKRVFHDSRVAGNAVQPLPDFTAGGSVLIDWLRQNPGPWTLAQIAEARGTTITTIRGHVHQHRDKLEIRRAESKGRPLVVSLKAA